MKRLIRFIFLLVFIVTASLQSFAQCSLCTKTAQQLGEKPSLGLNQGIMYLMFTPFAVMGFIIYKWWKNNRESE